MVLFEVKNLVKHFGGLAAVNNVSFQVHKGEIFGLIGPNGSGKTTIFNLISSFHPVTSGTIYFKYQNITGLKAHKVSKIGIARTFQEVKPLGKGTVLENIMAAAFSKTSAKHKARDFAIETLEFCRLAHRQTALAGSLPIGERRRLEIARALATRPELLLLDETASGLNASELNAAIDLIEAIRQKGVTIIVVEHIMKVIMAISHRIHAINFGQTIAEGTPREVANHPAVIEAYLGAEYQ